METHEFRKKPFQIKRVFLLSRGGITGGRVQWKHNFRICVDETLRCRVDLRDGTAFDTDFADVLSHVAFISC